IFNTKEGKKKKMDTDHIEDVLNYHVENVREYFQGLGPAFTTDDLTWATDPAEGFWFTDTIDQLKNKEESNMSVSWVNTDNKEHLREALLQQEKNRTEREQSRLRNRIDQYLRGIQESKRIIKNHIEQIRKDRRQLITETEYTTE